MKQPESKEAEAVASQFVEILEKWYEEKSKDLEGEQLRFLKIEKERVKEDCHYKIINLVDRYAKRFKCPECKWEDVFDNYDKYCLPFDHKKWQCPDCGEVHET